MRLEVLVVHAVLAFVLFFLVNWLGKHSIISGYIQLSPFAKADEAPAFNFTFRLLAPTVFVVLVAAIWYSVGLDRYVEHIWLVALFYVVGRWIFNTVVGRGRLLNWPEQVVMALLVVGLAYAVYDRVIIVRKNLLPDAANVTTELWLVVLVFVYQVLNRVTLPKAGTLRRKRAYQKRVYESAKRRFGHIIDAATPDVRLRMFIYSVLIYENFNRPAIYRWLERKVLLPLGRASSTGIMQVRAKGSLSDEESVRLGAKHLIDLYEDASRDGRDKLKQLTKTDDIPPSPQVEEAVASTPPDLSLHALFAAAAKYNIRSDYSSEVYGVYTELLATYHPGLSGHSKWSSRLAEARVRLS